jgi:predicted phosphodiesterase
MSRTVLVIGDTHFPAVHPDYLEFVKKIRFKYKCDEVVHIGDIVDHHCISFHKKHPEHPAAMDEFKAATKCIKKWYAAFPHMRICIGNHDERVARLAADAGIPDVYLKNWNELYDTPNWSWDWGHTIDDVFYTHGTGCSSLYPAFNAAKMRAMSVVMGHTHSVAGINWVVGPNTRFFGMNVGSGVDRNHLAMRYGSNYLKKPILSCGVVKDGHPYLELMNL